MRSTPADFMGEPTDTGGQNRLNAIHVMTKYPELIKDEETMEKKGQIPATGTRAVVNAREGLLVLLTHPYLEPPQNIMLHSLCTRTAQIQGSRWVVASHGCVQHWQPDEYAGRG